MASLPASAISRSSLTYSLPKLCQKRTIRATLENPKSGSSNVNPRLNFQNGRVAEELQFAGDFTFTSLTTEIIEKQANSNSTRNLNSNNDADGADDGNMMVVMEKLYAILEAVADRVMMHKNIGKQRENWNSLFLASINAITLAAATISSIAASTSVVGAAGAPVVAALKMSSTLMFLAATGMLLIINKIQPSQLAEEQRNATRLFQQMHNQIQTITSIGHPTEKDVKEAMEKVLALDKAYPLPLLGVMLEKFPSKVEPAVWWPQRRPRQAEELTNEMNSNGWNVELDKEMRSIVEVLRRKDKPEYLRLGGKALKLSKLLAISGPILTGLAAIGSAFVGSPSHGSWPAMLGVVGGALASIVNTLEHGGQVGMVFEMYRSNSGFFELMEESIESNLMERQENGELFEMKVALQLGRSLSELSDLAPFSSTEEENAEEFACKLF